MAQISQINDHIFIDHSKLLGKGSTGNVYLGSSNRYPHLKYAVKAIDLSQVNNEVTQYLLSCEIVALTQLSKLNIQSIVKLHEIAFQQGFCYLAMQLLQGGSLAEYIRQNPNGLDEKQAEILFRQMFQGYKAIKSQGIVHRDIKPDNIIFRYKQGSNRQVNTPKTICFIDFGYCTKQSVPNRPQVYYNVGSPKYMSPEAYKKNTYSQKSDIWALGVILYEMLHGKTIDKDMDMDQYLKFMEHNQLPITRNVNQFLKTLLFGMLAYDTDKRMSCQAIDHLLNRNFLANQNPILIAQASQVQFVHTVPQLEIPVQRFDRRNSPFYRSQIITHRSDPSQINGPMEFQHFQGSSFDPRRQQRNFSHEKSFQQFNRSPKKIIHVQQNFQRINRIVINNPSGLDKNNLSQNISIIQKQNVRQIFNGPTGPVRRQLERIEEENDEMQRQNNIKNNILIGNMRVEPDIRRSFLRAIDEGHFQPILNFNQHQPRIMNPNIRFVGGNKPTQMSSKPQQLARSEIFPVRQQVSDGRNQNFFVSQINNKQPEIKVITSDKTIQQRSGEYGQNNSLLNRNLNKSYSTQNVQMRNQSQTNNLRLNPSSGNQQLGLINQQSFEALPKNSQGLRPIDVLSQNREMAQNRAFLRNTMPNVYRSTIQQLSYGQNQQLNPNLNNSKDIRNNNESHIEQTNNSSFNNHHTYFDPNYLTPRKQILPDKIPVNTVGKNIESSFHVAQNRNEKTNSFRFASHQQTNLVAKEQIRFNIINQPNIAKNHSQQHPNIQNQAIVQQNHVNLLQNRPLNAYQQNIRIIQPPSPHQIPSTQSAVQPMQEKRIFFSNSEQKAVAHQNVFPQTELQLNQQEKERSMENLFRRSMIINQNQLANQTIEFKGRTNQERNQNSFRQQQIQGTTQEKNIGAHIISNNRQPLVMNQNQNIHINRMIRPTYPLASQQLVTQPITVNHF